MLRENAKLTTNATLMLQREIYLNSHDIEGERKKGKGKKRCDAMCRLKRCSTEGVTRC